MGMLFGGWAREDAEEELWYIKKYGLEAGQVAYQHAKTVEAAHTKWCQEHPEPIRWSNSEPRVSRGDKICKSPTSPEYHVTRIDDLGGIHCKMMTTDPMKDDPNLGAEIMWDQGEYKVLR